MWNLGGEPRVCCEHKTRGTRLQLNMQITNLNNTPVSPANLLLSSQLQLFTVLFISSKLLPVVNDRKTSCGSSSGTVSSGEPLVLMNQGRELLDDDLEKSDVLGAWTGRWHLDTPHFASSDTRGYCGSRLHRPLPTFINTPDGLASKHFNPLMSCHHAAQ